MSSPSAAQPQPACASLPAPANAAARCDGLERTASRQAQMLAVLTLLQRGFLVGETSSDTFAQMLDQLVRLTESEYGFIGEVLRDETGEPFLRMHGLSDISWSDESRKVFERMRAGGFEFHNLDSLFGVVVRTAEPLISNSPATDARSGGTPPGHPVLRSFMGLPLLHGGQLVGMIGLANAPGGYPDEMIGELEPMTATCATMIIALRMEQERNAAQLALQESEHHYRALANSEAALIWTAGADGLCNYFNDTWLGSPAGSSSRNSAWGGPRACTRMIAPTA